MKVMCLVLGCVFILVGLALDAKAITLGPSVENPFTQKNNLEAARAMHEGKMTVNVNVDVDVDVPGLDNTGGTPGGFYPSSEDVPGGFNSGGYPPVITIIPIQSGTSGSSQGVFIPVGYIP